MYCPAILFGSPLPWTAALAVGRLWQRDFEMTLTDDQGSVDSLCLVPGDPMGPVEHATAKKNVPETC
jgi:hypothetical protein